MTAGSILRGIAILLALQWVSVLFLQALHLAFPPALLGMTVWLFCFLAGVIREEKRRRRLYYPDRKDGHAVFTSRYQYAALSRYY